MSGDPTRETPARGRGRRIPILALVLVVALVGAALLWQRAQELPHIPYELAEYTGIGVADLGTAPLFADSATLKISIPARHAGRVRFVVAGDGGDSDDPGKRALERQMWTVCLRASCDFVLLLGDNVYPDGIDTFSASPLEDSIPGFDLRGEFLKGRRPADAAALAGRVRAAAGRVARACGALPGTRQSDGAGRGPATGSTLRASSTPRARALGRVASSPGVDAAPAAESPGGGGPTTAPDSSAAEAYRRHFEPKFERTFGWLTRVGIPAFAVLGNHDWRSPFGAECEIGYSLSPATAWRMPFYFYQVEVSDPGGGPPLANLLALYSAPPHATPAGENYARLGPRQRAWFESALARSRARWTLLASHHPVWTAGGHTFQEYRSFHTDVLGALAAAGREAGVLLAGHNHWLESARVEAGGRPALQVVSGSLSKVSYDRMLPRLYPFFNLLALSPDWRNRMREELGTDPDAFLAADHSALARGFALVELDEREARVRFYGVHWPLFGETFRKDEAAPAGED